jgi:hypothetical protein
MTIALTTDLLAFAEQRKTVQDRHEKDLLGSARHALRHHGERRWFDALLDRAAKLLRAQYHADTGKWTSAALRAAQTKFLADLRKQMEQTKKPVDLEKSARLIASSIATHATNLAAELAANDDDTPNDRFEKVWVSMEDEKVRPTHKAADGQRVSLSGKFKVGESTMSRPGDPSAPIEEWANCRCLLAIMSKDADEVAASLVASTDTTGVDMADDDDFPPVPEAPIDIAYDPVPWWGVLAPEDTMSGDGRKFAKDSLRSRPLPLPLSSQRANEPGHDGSVKTANIERMWRKDGKVFGSGHFLTVVPEADEVIAMMIESGGRTGVSVDADDGAAEMELRDGRKISDLMDEMEEGDSIDFEMDDLVTVFTTARVAGATTCNIPAFHEAFVAIGDVPEEFAPVEGEDLLIEARDDALVASTEAGLLMVPDTMEFGITSKPGTEDGPGWLTHPVDTDRLRDYWTHGAGAAKIGWGVAGDFNRCRAALAQYIKPNYLSGYCANRHKDALGFWPGQEGGGRNSLAASASPAFDGETMRPALSLVASADLLAPPDDWFADPQLTDLGALSITEEGRVFGYLAKWGTCHIGFDGVCIEPPHSEQDYAQFKTKYVVTESGEQIAVGVLTMDTGHADIRQGARPAAAHYDNTGTLTALVNIGEDERGIWVAGAVAPGTPPEKVYKMRASVLSGDWRDVAGSLELVAALHVNVGGFPVPRVAVAASGGHQTALVAAGLVLVASGGEPVQTTVEEIVEATRRKVAEQSASKAKMDELAAQRASDERKKMDAIALSAGRN